DQPAVVAAAVELAGARLGVRAAGVDEPERPVVEVGEGLQHLVVLLAELLRGRVHQERVAHVDAHPLDAHPVGEPDEVRHPLDRGAAVDPVQVRVDVPDHFASSLLISILRNATGSLWPANPKWPRGRSLPGCGWLPMNSVTLLTS